MSASFATEPLTPNNKSTPMAHETASSAAAGERTYSLEYASIAKFFTSSTRQEVKQHFDRLTDSAALGEWCPVGAQKHRQWAPKGSHWDEEKQWFVFSGEDPELSPRAMQAHTCSVSARAADEDPDERRRACRIWDKIEERFSRRRDARALAQSLAKLTSEGKRVQVYFWDGNGVRRLEASFDGTKTEKEPRKRGVGQCDEKGDKKRQCGVLDVAEVSAEGRLLKKEQVELLERKAKAEKKEALAKKEAFPMRALDMVTKQYPEMDLREQIFRARQIVSFMTDGQVEAQAGTKKPVISP
jgi:hypothetical protein